MIYTKRKLKREILVMGATSSTYDFLFWLSTLCLFASFLILLSRFRKQTKKYKLPPGPKGWPIIGNILELGNLPHRSLCKLKEKYGSVVWLRLGCLDTLVIQSAKAAEQLFKNHDLTFADRRTFESTKSHDYYHGSVAFGPYGAFWRSMRRLFVTEIMNNKRVSETSGLRQKCVDDSIKQIEQESAAKIAKGESAGEVRLSTLFFHMSYNFIMNVVLSKDLKFDSESKEGQEFFDAMNNVTKCLGQPNISDFLPYLRWLDPQGIKRKTDRDFAKGMKIISGIVSERIKERKLGIKTDKTTPDFLDSMLDYKGDGKDGALKFTNHQINLFIMEMFLAGTDTMSIVIDFVMAELFKNPEAMRKVKEELDEIIGPNRKVEENDLNNLPYLQAVVDETLRLHPPGPLLIPRKVRNDVEFMEYFIPKGTQVFVNVWAIGRDPESWGDDVLSFKPERFLKSNINFKGLHYEFLPFGSGRRICPGIPLAQRFVPLVLAAILHYYDWKLPNNMTPEDIDMNEDLGISLRKVVPLEAIPTKRVLI